MISTPLRCPAANDAQRGQVFFTNQRPRVDSLTQDIERCHRMVMENKAERMYLPTLDGRRF